MAMMTGNIHDKTTLISLSSRSENIDLAVAPYHVGRIPHTCGSSFPTIFSAFQGSGWWPATPLSITIHQYPYFLSSMVKMNPSSSGEFLAATQKSYLRTAD
nr:hypothetical protein Itr_chr12CG00360 [Ipomoea trifida]GME17214.1 hypothetical protein Iba_scaffold18403CG0780 [Ipomoea batatas]